MGAPRRRTAVLLALHFYGREVARNRRVAVPALLLPALGNTCRDYGTPLVVAALAGRVVAGGELGPAVVLPYVLGFAALHLLSEAFWRVGIHFLNRTAAPGVEHLYTLGMNELLAKDAAFFHDNFAGSLTKRVLSFAVRFEEAIVTVTFAVVGSVVPLVFASVVLWTYDPMLVVVLLSLIVLTGVFIAPLVRRRQVLVDRREAAVARVSGHVADSLANMDTVRAFAAEEREAAEHRSRVAEQRRLTIRSWDYSNQRIDTVVAGMCVLTNALGLLVAVGLGGGRLGVEVIVVTFAYFWNATRVMFEFNPIYRRLESSVTEAAQFTELLLTPPAVRDPVAPEPLRVNAADVRFDRVTFAYDGAPPLFDRLDLTVPSGTTMGLVGRSGGGKSTLTKLLLRLMDVQGGRILIGGQDISRITQADLRGLISYVPQDPAMFHRTLRENIAFGRPGPARARRTSAARPRPHTSPSSSTPSRRGSTRSSGSGGSSCRAVSASGSPSRAPSCATRRSSCSTRPPARWTRRARSSSRTPCGGSWMAAPRSSWPTG